MKMTPFRIWLQNLWFDHKDEVLEYEGRVCTEDAAEWVKRNKWFLKRKYKNQK